MKWKEKIIGLQSYQPGRTINEVKQAYGLENITKLASNENPYGYSPTVRKALQEGTTQFELYPDGAASSLKKALSDYLQLPTEQIILGNGSDDLLSIISRSLLQPGNNTVMANPSFSQYKHNATVEGAEIREVPLVDGKHDLPAMLEAIDEDTAVVWVCSPNNPTGVYITSEELTAFLDDVPRDVLVVLDEAYREYVTAEDYPDSLELIKRYPNLIAVRTFSKIYGLASFRVGYGYGNLDIISQLEPVRQPFNVNTLGQAVGEIALGDQDFIKDCREKNRKGLEQFYSFCEREGLHYFPSQANFILMDVKADANKAFEYLMSKGYIIRSGQALGFPTYIRVTVGSAEENEGFLEQLQGFLETQRTGKLA
ncbi:histidinol-phosphate transaminase [Bacillus testis]|uniref:histidinol-phosphate transaminase n=1 Tax=Bacillus testis TaxID=1622072 RepID=UPI00067ED22B|nr:histidinol-phosphate transaminase [Bacillus testis]